MLGLGRKKDKKDNFKFQSDSINTADKLRVPRNTIGFKFQSDSINTGIGDGKMKCPKCFKFQSDSINTKSNLSKFSIDSALNSNLILLIQARIAQAIAKRKALNSNLILLIPLKRHQLSKKSLNFKFQSDSINTQQTWISKTLQAPLNSNLILLIPLPDKNRCQTVSWL